VFFELSLLKVKKKCFLSVFFVKLFSKQKKGKHNDSAGFKGLLQGAKSHL